MATVEQLAQALAEVRQQLGEAHRLAMEAQRSGVQSSTTSTGHVDPRVMNTWSTFSGRDTEWSEWSFIFESVAAMANLEPSMEGALTGDSLSEAQKSITASQHGDASRPSTSPTQLDGTQRCSLGVMLPG